MKVNSCIRNLLKLILVLQNNSMDISCGSNDCSKPFLGPSLSIDCYNTRVITLYMKDGSLFNGTFNDGNTLIESPYFRIQDIDNDCCTLMILNYVDGAFIPTRRTIVVNIGCICAIKCIEDIRITL